MDPIADFITQIRNATRANPKRATIEAKSSRTKKRITEILYKQGYIKSYAYDDDKNYQGVITIELKYHPRTKASAIIEITRISKPGKRIYVKAKDLPQKYNELDNYIISTSKGIITGKQARQEGVGGEVLIHVF